MDEVFKYQEAITSSIRSENVKFSEIQAKQDLDRMIDTARDYSEKLTNIKKTLVLMKDKTSKLKQRTAKLVENKNREEVERQRSIERRRLLERHLEPVVNTRRD